MLRALFGLYCLFLRVIRYIAGSDGCLSIKRYGLFCKSLEALHYQPIKYDESSQGLRGVAQCRAYHASCQS